MGVQGRECLQQPPPLFPPGPSRYPASFWASGAGLIPLQPGRTPWSLNSLNRSHENMFGISQKANRLWSENKKLCLQSSKENRFRLECVCVSFSPSEATGTHLRGSPFWSPAQLTPWPTSRLTPWFSKACGRRHHSYFDLRIWQTSSQTWTKWVCHFKGSNWQCLWPTITFNLSSENENFWKTFVIMSLTTSPKVDFSCKIKVVFKNVI